MTEPTRARTRLVKAFQQGNWTLVQHRAATLLQTEPDDADALFMNGVALLQTHKMTEALSALDKAVQLQPERTDFLAQYAMALALMRRLRAACETADRAMVLTLEDAHVAELLGQVYLQAHAIERAANAFHHAMRLKPVHAPYRFLLGYALAAMGDTGGAERHLEACIDLEPRHWPAHLSLAKLRHQTPETQHIERMSALLRKYGNDPGAQIFLNMALAKEHEDLADYPTAYVHYAHGKAAARRTRPASADRDRNMFEALTRAFPAALEAPGDDETPDAPIFIIGMPRTGTTLLNRIVSSHPEVFAAGELQNFPTQLQLASGSPIALLSTPDIAEHTANIDWNKLGEAYIESTRPATGQAPRFTDDMPHNFLYAGFIARALPRARILCLRRDPLDTCLGNFRHLFDLKSGFYDYSLDLLDTGRYYIQFDRLMAHWRKVLPGRILEVSYESLVQDPEPAVRDVLAFCGLPWNDACLHTESNTAPVNTPNAWQVRSPIYATAVGRWRHYASRIQPLRDLLTNAGIACADD